MDDQLKNLDLRLLMLLKVLVKTKSTSKAAEQLGISQSSASKGLEKLRAAFGDHLFIRKPYGIEPSEMAIKLAEAMDALLLPVSNVLRDYQNFDPLEYTGNLSIVANTFLLEVIGAEIILHLKSIFPKATFNITSWNEHSIAELLEGKHDYGIQLEQVPLPQDLYSQKIYSEGNLIFARQDHPVLDSSTTWEDIAELPLVILRQPVQSMATLPLLKTYRELGHDPEVQLISTSLSAANAFLKTSDAIMYATETLIRLTDGLSCYPVPNDRISIGTTVLKGCLLQTRRNYPMHKYLHGEMKTLFSRL
ncbi:LysR family transcriptional regulator [Vibrio lamellibrachiae]|uniref:LysR family transcriptional regulator n=1 Tax=Vibrio lamellibrachiae TaxID=2910253 RepID=UPI003D134B4E